MTRTLARLALAAAAAAVIVPLSTATVASKAERQAPSVFSLDVPVNIVYIGFDRGDVNRAVLQAELPHTGTPIARSPAFYGLSGRDLGLRYTYRYRHVTADPRFENEFFAFLAAGGTETDLTPAQRGYNSQTRRIRDIVGPGLFIDGPTVESWLDRHAGRLGVNTTRGYTVYFVNWYGRSDFRFHSYTKDDEPDEDTGFNWGAYPPFEMSAWGGTSSRSWFYDISGGPSYYTYGWKLDTADVDGDGEDDYRIPPIWEYAAGGFRDPAQLSSDLGKLVRYVAIDLLFTSSPLYDPANTRPGAGGRKVGHINVFEDDPAQSGLDFIRAARVRQHFSDLEPYYQWSVRLRDYRPIDAGSQRAFRIWAGLDNSDDCWNAWGTTWGELFCYYDALRSEYVPTYGRRDYVAGVMAFNTTAANMNGSLLGGFADDNWIDGTQLFTYLWHYPWPRPPFVMQGLGILATHEMGHHFGLSHPHDGYDSESGVDYFAGGDRFFAWAGDESHTVMNYLLINNGFGRFNQDNMDRWEMAASLQAVDQLSSSIDAHPSGRQHGAELERFRAERGQILAAFGRWDFREAATRARQLYEAVTSTSTVIGLPEHHFDAPVRSFTSTGFNKFDGRVFDRPGPRGQQPRLRW